MNLTVNNEVTKSIYGPLEFSEDLTLSDFIALLKFETDFDETKNEIFCNGQLLDHSQSGEKTLKALNILDNCTLTIRLKKFDPIDQLRLKLLKDEKTPEILKDDFLFDLNAFKEFVEFVKYSPASRDKPLVQVLKDNALLEEIAYSKKIDDQMRHAMEYTPENFTTVSMLYINMEINGHPVKAFVDSGAQNTIMSTKLAKLTKLDKLVDKRFKGEARGVGVSNIVGKIHSALVKIESQFVACSFTVLDINVDLLLGLDMLKRYQACIDLEKNVLKFAGIETPFLGEADIPKEDLAVPPPAALAEQPVSTGPSTIKTSKRPISEIQSSTETKQPKTYTNATSADSIPETSINTLMELGFSRDQVTKALEVSNGNTDLAASILYNM